MKNRIYDQPHVYAMYGNHQHEGSGQRLPRQAAVAQGSQDRFESGQGVPCRDNTGTNINVDTLVRDMVLEEIQIEHRAKGAMGAVIGGAVDLITGNLHAAIPTAENAAFSLTPDTKVALVNACNWASEYILALPISAQGRSDLKTLIGQFKAQAYLFRLSKETYAAYGQLQDCFVEAAMNQKFGARS